MTSWPEIAMDASIGAAVLVGRAAVTAGERTVGAAASGCSRAVRRVWDLTPSPLAEELRRQTLALAATGQEARASLGNDSASLASTLSMHVAQTETVRTIVLSVVEQAIDEILEQAVPATLEAMQTPELVERTDEIMSQMLLRVMPDVLERTLPTSMIRVTTRAPADIVPLLRAAARLDR